LVTHACDFVVGGVAVCEAIGIEEIEDVGGVEAAISFWGALSCFQTEFIAEDDSILLQKFNGEAPRFGFAIDHEIEDEVVGVFEVVGLLEADAFVGELGVGLGDVFGVDEELELRGVHVDPPGGWGDGSLSLSTRLSLREEEEKKGKEDAFHEFWRLGCFSKLREILVLLSGDVM
jgi:hypothetical protein